MVQYIRRCTHVRLALDPHHADVWSAPSAPGGTGGLILAGFGVAAGVVYARPDLFRVHKHKLLRLLVPLVFQFLLADGADSVRRRGVGYHHILLGRVNVGGLVVPCAAGKVAGVVGAIWREGGTVFAVVTGFNPFLRKGEGKSQHAFSE